MNKLSKIMWVQAGYGNCRRVMPFVLKENLIISLADDKLFQYTSNKTMYDQLYEICQNEYKYSTVVIHSNSSILIPHLDISNRQEPKILNIKLPKILMLKHKKEYSDYFYITLSNREIKLLAKYLTKENSKNIQKAVLNSMHR